MNASQYVELLRAIRAHSGLELSSIREAGAYGADAGWAGFVYTNEAAVFFDENRRLILDVLADDAEALGYDNVAAFVATFNRADMTNTDGGYECLLSWYALEEVGRFMSDRREQRTVYAF